MKRGESENTNEIQGTEKKKYLDIWRLQKDTTMENVEKYAKNLYGREVPVKVDKIKYKTVRDYSLFIIGVPESLYAKLCEPDSWQVNIEFCEWVWFRGQPKRQKSAE